MSRRCSICSFPLVTEVDALLASGSSVRSVARLYSLSRTTLARHAGHIAPTSKRFAVIAGTSDPLGPDDPLASAFRLAEQARTPRERLRALEQIRASVRLRLRDVEDIDAEDRELLDANVRSAERAFRDAPDFETAARALSGWREAISQRLTAPKRPDVIEVPMTVATSEGKPLGPPTPWPMTPSEYWAGIPQRYRDAERFVVERVLQLQLGKTAPRTEITVRQVDHDVVVWTSR